MEVTFRELIKDDIDFCQEIIREIYVKSSEREWPDILRRELSEVLGKAYPSKCIVALMGNAIIGLGCYVKVQDPSTSNIIYKLTWINISPKHQRTGVGIKLIGQLEEHIRRECKEDFYVTLETDKPDFYNKLGYTAYNKNGSNDVMEKFFPKIVYPKILIGTLFSEIKDYCIRDWFKNICQLTYPNFDICLVDNSKDKKYHKKIFKYFSEHKKKSNIGKLTILHAPRTHKKSEIFMAFSANELRKYFLKNNYDWMLNLECDIFPPTDIVQRLLCYNKPVIGATYFSGGKNESYPMLMELYTYDKMQITTNIPYIKGFYEMTDTFEPKPYTAQGVGCTLIHREILKTIPFKADMTETAHYDIMFYYDLIGNGIANHLVPIVCRHENQTWDIQNKMLGVS